MKRSNAGREWCASSRIRPAAYAWSARSVLKSTRGWLEDHRYLNMEYLMEYLKEQKKELRTAA